MRCILLVSAVFSIFSCQNSFDKQLSELLSSKHIWLEYSKNRDYTFIYTRYCKCPFDGEEVQIKVSRSKIVSAEIGDKKINPKSLSTMNQLFELIWDSIKKQEWVGDVNISAKYHERYGYPIRIKISRGNSHKNIMVIAKNVKFY